MPTIESLPRLTEEERELSNALDLERERADLDRKQADRKEALTSTLTRLQGLLVLIAGDVEGFTTLRDEQQASILKQLAELSGKALETANTI